MWTGDGANGRTGPSAARPAVRGREYESGNARTRDLQATDNPVKATLKQLCTANSSRARVRSDRDFKGWFTRTTQAQAYA